MIIDGKKIADDIIENLLAERTQYGTLKLGIVLKEGNSVIESFLRVKATVAKRLNVELIRRELTETDTTQDAIRIVEELQQQTNGVIVQFPFIKNADTRLVLHTISTEKDVDAIGLQQEPLVLTPVVAAIEEIFIRERIDPIGKKILIAGHGRLVGKPTESWFKKRYGIVPIIVTDSSGLERHAPESDIIVLGIGIAGILKPIMIKKDCIILDAGASETYGRVAGDADPSCSKKALIFTPVPGGIGPITVAILFRNLFFLAKRQN